MRNKTVPKSDKARNPLILWWRSRAKTLPLDAIPTDRPYFSGSPPFIVVLAAALVGAFAAGFLAYRHLLIVTETAAIGQSALCRADGRIDCDAVLLTEYAVLFDYVSSAVLGLMGFVFVIWLSVNALANQRLRKLSWVILVLYFFAAIGFSWYFLYVMMYKVHHICPWCLVVHGVNFFSLIVIVAVSIRRKREFLYPEISTMAERVYFVLGGVLLSLLVFFCFGMAESTLGLAKSKAKNEQLVNNPAVSLALVQSSPSVDVPIGKSDPVFGDPSAPYPLIVFSDFACPVCAAAEYWLGALVMKNPGVLKLIYKNFPLSSECNKTLVSDLHPKGCEAARAAYAVFLLAGNNDFWEYGESLFAHQKTLASSPWFQLAERFKLDREKFLDLLKDGSPADKKVSEDVELGIRLGLNATPQIFFENKRLPVEAKPVFLAKVIEGLIRSSSPGKESFTLNLP